MHLFLRRTSPYIREVTTEAPSDLFRLPPSNNRIVQQIKADLRACPQHTAFQQAAGPTQRSNSIRTIFGTCSKAGLGINNLFCGCCVFSQPDEVLDTLLVNYFLPLYSPSLYEGFAVEHLLPAADLGNLGSRETLVEFQASEFTWRQLVSRHLSRRHWRAVQLEQERMLAEWTRFIETTQAKRPQRWKQEKKLAYLSELLLPAQPPQPPDGCFLRQTQSDAELREALQQSTSAFFLQYGLTANPTKPQQYAPHAMNWQWELHGPEEARDASDAFVESHLIGPEKVRRQTNACMNFYANITWPPLMTPHQATPTTFLARTTTESVEWEPSEEEIVACQGLLQLRNVVAWARYSEAAIMYPNRRMWKAMDIEAVDCLRRLLLHHPFAASVVFTARWQTEPALDGPCTFALAISTDGDTVAALITELQTAVDEHAVCTEKQFWFQPPPTSEQLGLGWLTLTVEGEESV
jgi:hypothetical protein